MAATVDCQSIFTENRKLPQSDHVNILSQQKTFPDELQRLQTFAKYVQSAGIFVSLLARQGFIYIGNGTSDDTILCVLCNAVIKNMDENCDVEKTHRVMNPNCPIVKGLNGENEISEMRETKTDMLTLQIVSSSLQTGAKELTHQSQDYIHQPQVSCDTHHPEAGTGFLSEIVTNHASALPSPLRSSPSSPTDSVSFNSVQGQTHCQAATVMSDGGLLSRGSPVFQSEISSSSRGNENIIAYNNDENERSSESSIPQHNSPDTSNSNSNRSEENTSTPSNSEVPMNNQLSSNSQLPSERSVVQYYEERVQQGGVVPSLKKLEIITTRPKRLEYALEVTRLQSFAEWPSEHHIKREELAKAGYFYTGYSDCARCFYCGGGIRNWEMGDDVWVEHSRWFAKCPFIRHNVGQPFIDVVQDMSEEHETIPYDDVIAEMRTRGLEKNLPIGIKDSLSELEKDPAVKTLIEDGFKRDDVMKSASIVKEMGQMLGADLIYEELCKQKVTRSRRRRTPAASASQSARNSTSLNNTEKFEKRDKETIESLKNKNDELRQMSQCKICMDKDSSVVFLPCGHLVSCIECSYALTSCPVCRADIKGATRAIFN